MGARRLVSRIRALTRYGFGYAAMSVVGRAALVRALFGLFVRWRRPARSTATGAASSVLEPEDFSAALAPLRRDGVVTGLRLRREVVEEMRQALAARPCYGACDPRFGFLAGERDAAEARFGRRFVQAHYFGLDEAHPVFGALRRDMALLQIARGYFGCEPIWAGTRVWSSFAVDVSEEQRRLHGQCFHYDFDFFNALNFFFYLTDVDVDDGPHVMVRGSHREKRLKHLLRLERSRTDEEMLRDYGADRIAKICGRAGTGFAEDPFAFHKATQPRRGDRLILQVRYAMHDYGAAKDTGYSVRFTSPQHA